MVTSDWGVPPSPDVMHKIGSSALIVYHLGNVALTPASNSQLLSVKNLYISLQESTYGQLLLRSAEVYSYITEGMSELPTGLYIHIYEKCVDLCLSARIIGQCGI